MESAHNPENQLLHPLPVVLRTFFHSKTHTQMFTAAVIIIANKTKKTQAHCSLTDEWVKRKRAEPYSGEMVAVVAQGTNNTTTRRNCESRNSTHTNPHWNNSGKKPSAE